MTGCLSVNVPVVCWVLVIINDGSRQVPGFGFVNLHVYDGACQRICGYAFGQRCVHRLIFRAFTGNQQIVALRCAFHQNGNGAAQVKLVLFVSMFLHDVDKAIEALLDDLVRRVVDHLCGGRAFALRIDEREYLMIANGVDKARRILEILLGFTWEADDDVG